MTCYNVTKYQVINNDIYYINNEGELYKNEFKIMQIDNSADIYYENQIIYFVSNDDSRLLLTIPELNLKFGKGIINIKSSIIFYYYGGFMDHTYGIAELKNESSIIQLFETKDFRPFVKYENFIVGTGGYKIYCTNYITNTPLWQLPLSELGPDPYDANASDDVKEILGVVGNNLWFYSRCGRLVAVDAESGRFKIIYEGFNFFQDIKSQNIISISSNLFSVIDTATLELKEQYYFKEQDPTGIGKFSSIYSPLLQGDYFTFLAEKDEDYGGTRRVGIFDYKARKLVWEHEVFTQEEVNRTKVKLLHPRPLKMSEDTKKLYILDSADTLHIFEREENV